MVFFCQTMVKGQQLLRQRGRGRARKGSADARKRPYMQHTRTDVHRGTAIHHWNMKQRLQKPFDVFAGVFLSELGRAVHPQLRLMWHGGHSPCHSVTARQPENEPENLGALSLVSEPTWNVPHTHVCKHATRQVTSNAHSRLVFIYTNRYLSVNH